MQYDIIIRDGYVVDGTGAPGFYGDVAIKDGKVAAVGPQIRAIAKEEIDASGKIVAPGHVTQHTHYDAQIFWDPYCSNSGELGVTTVVNGNCGFSIAPVRMQDRDRTMAMLSTTEQIPVEFQRQGLPWNWETFPEFLDRISDLPKGINVMQYLPLNPLLVYVMGIEGAKTRRPKPSEIAKMHDLINEAMNHGALGISMSVMGAEGNSHLDSDGTAMPTDMLHDDDVVAICRALIDRGEGVVQMLSQIAFYGNRPVSEKVARAARGSGVRVIHNAFITSDALSELTQQDIEWAEGLRAEGLDVSGAALINRGWVESSIRQLDTSSGQLTGVRRIMATKSDDELKQLLADSTYLEEFEAEYESQGPANASAGLEGQTVIDVGAAAHLEDLIGKTLAEIARDRDTSVIRALASLALETDLKIQIRSAPFSADNPQLALDLLNSPAVSAGVSDGGAHCQSFSNGQYATELIIWLVRDEKKITLERLHYELSFNVARTLMLENRGALLPGFWADILVYDLDALWLDRLRHEIVHDMPGGGWRRKVRAGGYSRIIVNGQTTFVDDDPTGALPGQLLRITQDLAGERKLAA